MFDFNEILKFILNPKFYVPLLTIIIFCLITKVFSKTIKRLLINDAKLVEDKRRNTIVVLVSNILKYVFVIVGLCIILATYGVNVKGILAGLGIAGAIAGLAFQDALKDIISGCNIILDNYFIIGDLVEVNDFTGYVIEFGLKNTKVKDFDGNVLIISNREISHVVNMSQKHASIPIALSVAYEHTEKEVREVLEKAMNEINKLPNIVEKCEYLGIEELSDSSVTYMIKVHAKPDYKYDVRRKSLNEIKNKFDEYGIKIPYPQLEVHNGKKL